MDFYRNYSKAKSRNLHRNSKQKKHAIVTGLDFEFWFNFLKENLEFSPVDVEDPKEYVDIVLCVESKLSMLPAWGPILVYPDLPWGVKLTPLEPLGKTCGKLEIFKVGGTTAVGGDVPWCCGMPWKQY